MLGRAFVVVTVLSGCVLSLPVTSSHLENEDVKVMKCVVEALADVLSRPKPVPISQECLVILRTDDRLVSILRHHNFLKELQDIAVQGANERSQLQGDIMALDRVTQIPESTSNVADRSMLEAFGGPGERSILEQTKRRTEAAGGREEEEDERLGEEESQEHNEAAGKEEERRRQAKSSDEHVSEWGEDKHEKRGEEEEDGGKKGHEGGEEKRRSSKDDSEEALNKKDDESAERRNAPKNKSEEKSSAEEEEEEEKRRRSTLFPHGNTPRDWEKEGEGEGSKDEEEEEVKRDSEWSNRWTKRANSKASPASKKNAIGKEEREEQEVPHHSREAAEEEEEEEVKKEKGIQKSPEEKVLQTEARRTPEEKRGLEEEGSASRKPEEPEIASLAAIESELENVAQKLHELRQG